MLVDHVRTESVSQAVTHTFDGLHPCCLCKAIAKAKKTEQKNESSVALVRLEFVPFAGKIYLPNPGHGEISSSINTFFTDRTRPPPPRTLQVC